MKKIEIDRSDFVTLHNNLNEAIWRLAVATNVKKGLTPEETKAVFDLIFPLAKGTQSIVVDNGFTCCVASSICK